MPPIRGHDRGVLWTAGHRFALTAGDSDARDPGVRGSQEVHDMQTDPRAEANGRLRRELALVPDSDAPSAARTAVAGQLAATVAPSVLERAQLIASELVTNSVRHSGARSEDRLRLRIETTHAAIRLEVEDAGRGAAVAIRPIGSDSEDGFGLNIVEALSDRWGAERDASRGARAWAELALAAGPEPR